MMKQFLVWLSLLASLTPAMAQYPAEVSVNRLKPGDLVPKIIGKTLDGKDLNLHEDLRGKVVLLDFWATWCGPCVAETPNIKRSYDKFHGQGFEVLAISLDQDVSKAEAYHRDQSLTWLGICDGLAHNGPIPQAYSVRGIPALVLLGRDGRVLVSGARGEELTRAIASAMQGDGIAPKSSATGGAQFRQENERVAALRQTLQANDSEAALQAVRQVLSEQRLSPEECASLAYDLGNRIDGLKHPEAIYLLADAAFQDGTITEDDLRTAGMARAHAAIELGGPYLVHRQLSDMKRYEAGLNGEMIALVVHACLKRKDYELLTSTLLEGVRSHRLLYPQIKDVLTLIKVPEDTEGLDEIEFWLGSQEGLPADRAEVLREGELLRVRYRPRHTNLAGVMNLNVMMRVNGSQFFAIPMGFAKGGWFEATIPIEENDAKPELYFCDAFGRSDTNEGAYWKP